MMNQISQSRLKEIVSSHNVTFANDKLCHTPPEQQTKMITPYKLYPQECDGGMHFQYLTGVESSDV